MKLPLVLPVLLALALTVAAPASAATPNAVLKAQLRAQKLKVAKLTGQLAKLKTKDAATIAGLNGQVVTLTGQVTKQAQGGLAAVLAGSPDDMWGALIAIWQVFPTMPESSYCGFNKTNDLTGGTGLNITRYSFVNYTNCT